MGQIKYCEQCGSPLVSGEAFCDNCGAAVPSNRPGRANSADRGKEMPQRRESRRSKETGPQRNNIRGKAAGPQKNNTRGKETGSQRNNIRGKATAPQQENHRSGQLLAQQSTAGRERQRESSRRRTAENQNHDMEKRRAVPDQNRVQPIRQPAPLPEEVRKDWEETWERIPGPEDERRITPAQYFLIVVIVALMAALILLGVYWVKVRGSGQASRAVNMEQTEGLQPGNDRTGADTDTAGEDDGSITILDGGGQAVTERFAG